MGEVKLAEVVLCMSFAVLGMSSFSLSRPISRMLLHGTRHLRSGKRTVILYEIMHLL